MIWKLSKTEKVNFIVENLSKTNMKIYINGKKKWKPIFDCCSLKTKKKQRI